MTTTLETTLKIGDIVLTGRGERVEVVSLDKVPCTTNWITVKTLDNPKGMKPVCIYISPDGLRAI